MTVTICAPSYRRPNAVDTLKYLPSCRVYVSTREEAAYKAANPGAEIVGVDPKFAERGTSVIRNYILDHATWPVLMVDDDLQHINRWERLERKRLETEAEVVAFVERYTDLCREWACPAWGVNINSDGQVYREQTPFSLTSYISASFTVHVDHKCRYDERLPLKEDYDLTLQLLNQYRRVLRINSYYYLTLQAVQVGGCATYRSVEKEAEQLALLQRKWGEEIVRADSMNTSRNHLTTKRRRIDINPVIRPPIRGV